MKKTSHLENNIRKYHTLLVSTDEKNKDSSEIFTWCIKLRRPNRNSENRNQS